MVEFNANTRDGFTMIEFELDGPLAPEALPDLTRPDVDPTKGVVLSGRGPVWLFAFLAHAYHHVAWVGTHDPRLGGAVVVASHAPGVAEGNVVPV